jgi:hypothetical protein
MSGEAICTSCSRDRVLKDSLPVGSNYDLKLYQCDACLSHIWLVSKTSAHDLQRSQGRRPSPSRKGIAVV